MRILILGAGVIGCNLAKDLVHSGKDVTLLARGVVRKPFGQKDSVSKMPYFL